MPEELPAPDGAAVSSQRQRYSSLMVQAKERMKRLKGSMVQLQTTVTAPDDTSDHLANGAVLAEEAARAQVRVRAHPLAAEVDTSSAPGRAEMKTTMKALKALKERRASMRVQARPVSPPGGDMEPASERSLPAQVAHDVSKPSANAPDVPYGNVQRALSKMKARLSLPPQQPPRQPPQASAPPSKLESLVERIRTTSRRGGRSAQPTGEVPDRREVEDGDSASEWGAPAPSVKPPERRSVVLPGTRRAGSQPRADPVTASITQAVAKQLMKEMAAEAASTGAPEGSRGPLKSSGHPEAASRVQPELPTDQMAGKQTPAARGKSKQLSREVPEQPAHTKSSGDQAATARATGPQAADKLPDRSTPGQLIKPATVETPAQPGAPKPAASEPPSKPLPSKATIDDTRTPPTAPNPAASETAFKPLPSNATTHHAAEPSPPEPASKQPIAPHTALQPSTTQMAAHEDKTHAASDTSKAPSKAPSDAAQDSTRSNAISKFPPMSVTSATPLTRQPKAKPTVEPQQADPQPIVAPRHTPPELSSRQPTGLEAPRRASIKLIPTSLSTDSSAAEQATPSGDRGFLEGVLMLDQGEAARERAAPQDSPTEGASQQHTGLNGRSKALLEDLKKNRLNGAEQDPMWLQEPPQRERRGPRSGRRSPSTAKAPPHEGSSPHQAAHMLDDDASEVLAQADPGVEVQLDVDGAKMTANKSRSAFKGRKRTGLVTSTSVPHDSPADTPSQHAGRGGAGRSRYTTDGSPWHIPAALDAAGGSDRGAGSHMHPEGAGSHMHPEGAGGSDRGAGSHMHPEGAGSHMHPEGAGSHMHPEGAGGFVGHVQAHLSDTLAHAGVAAGTSTKPSTAEPGLGLADAASSVREPDAGKPRSADGGPSTEAGGPGQAHRSDRTKEATASSALFGTGAVKVPRVQQVEEQLFCLPSSLARTPEPLVHSARPAASTTSGVDAPTAAGATSFSARGNESTSGHWPAAFRAGGRAAPARGGSTGAAAGPSSDEDGRPSESVWDADPDSSAVPSSTRPAAVDHTSDAAPHQDFTLPNQACGAAAPTSPQHAKPPPPAPDPTPARTSYSHTAAVGGGDWWKEQVVAPHRAGVPPRGAGSAAHQHSSGPQGGSKSAGGAAPGPNAKPERRTSSSSYSYHTPPQGATWKEQPQDMPGGSAKGAPTPKGNRCAKCGKEFSSAMWMKMHICFGPGRGAQGQGGAAGGGAAKAGAQRAPPPRPPPPPQPTAAHLAELRRRQREENVRAWKQLLEISEEGRTRPDGGDNIDTGEWHRERVSSVVGGFTREMDAAGIMRALGIQVATGGGATGVKSAYKRAALKFHPDMNQRMSGVSRIFAEEVFKALTHKVAML